jgi:cytochrome c553
LGHPSSARKTKRDTVNYKIFAIHCITTTIALMSLDAGANRETDLMLINSCKNCHNPHIITDHIPNIAGLHREQILSMLKSFKDNTSTGTIMNRIISTYEIADMEKLADYYSSLTLDNPPPLTTKAAD